MVLAPLLRGAADVVYGSRFLSGQPHRVLYYWHSVGNRMLTTLSNMFTNLNLTDMETCYKAFRREVIRSRSRSRRIGSASSPRSPPRSRAAAGGYARWASRYAGRTYAEGKKITWRDGMRAAYSIVRYSNVWRPVRGHLDRVPTATSARGVRRCRFRAGRRAPDTRGRAELHGLDLQPRRTPPRQRGARDRRGPRRAHRAPATRAHRDGHRSLDELRRQAPLPLLATLERRRPPGRHRIRRPTGACTTPSCSSTCSSTSTTTQGALEKLRAVLRPGGRLCVFVPAFDGLYSTSTNASATGGATAVRSWSSCSTAPVSRSSTRTTSTRSARSRGGFSPPTRSGPDADVVGRHLRPAGRPETAQGRGEPPTAFRPVVALRRSRRRLKECPGWES